MRKDLAVLLALLALGIGGVAYAAASTVDSADAVTVTERIVTGDRSALEGLKIDVQRYWRNQHFWTIHHDFEKGETVTDYRYTQEREYEEYESIPNGLMLSNEVGASLWIDQPSHPLYSAYEQLAERTSPGMEDNSYLVYLKDHFDYYPINVTVDISVHSSYGINEHELYSSDLTSLGEVNVELYNAFNEFFRIPVLADDRVVISLDKNSKGEVVSVGTSSIGRENYNMWTESVIAEDAVYFYVNRYSGGGELMDFSLVPGGYGIYRLPYHWDEENGVYVRGDDGMFVHEPIAVPDMDGLEMVYAIPEGMNIRHFELSPDKKNILMFTDTEGLIELRVIEIGSMETLQCLELQYTPPEEEDSYFGYVNVREGYITCWLGGEKRLALLTEHDGVYDIEFTCDTEGLYAVGNREEYAWDGERLVVIHNGTADSPEYAYYSCDYTLAVFTADGLQFHGEYKCSLSGGDYEEGHSRTAPYARDRKSFEIMFE